MTGLGFDKTEERQRHSLIELHRLSQLLATIEDAFAKKLTLVLKDEADPFLSRLTHVYRAGSTSKAMKTRETICLECASLVKIKNLNSGLTGE